MNNKLLELARAVVDSEIPANYSYCPFCDNDYMGGESDTHTADCPWLLLKQEVDRIDSQKAIYKRTGEGLKFTEPCKPQPYEVK